MSLADNIKSLRRKSFLTQEQFAKVLGVSFATINRWESGKAKPNLNAMKKIKEFCEEHNIDFNELETSWL